jgi:hypothetical protein
MKINILLFFLVRTVSLLGQEQYLTTLEKMGFNSKKQFEYNFVHTEKGAFFVSDKTQVSAVQVTDGKDNNLSCIYYVTCRKNKYGPPKKVDINFSNHIGSFTVNEKENFIVFTGRQAKTAVTFGLFQTEKIKGKWSEPTLVIKDMEQSNFTDPFLTKSGDTLLFASDLPGGNGGLDLYYGIGVKGNWSRVEKISETSASHFFTTIFYTFQVIVLMEWEGWTSTQMNLLKGNIPNHYCLTLRLILLRMIFP